MPVSKKRKRAGKKVVRQPVVTAADLSKIAVPEAAMLTADARRCAEHIK